MRMRGAGRNIVTLVMVLLLVLIGACVPTPEKTTPTPTPTPERVTPPPKPEPTPIVELGIIEIRVTDPPPPSVTSAVVHLENIEAHKVVGEEGEWITIIDVPPSFDLLDVLGGVKEVLGAVETQAGSFTQIRMDVTKVELVTVDGDEITATVPSGKLKIVRPFNVEGGVKTILTLDFDGDKSLILPGKDIATGKERALFKPVVKLSIEKEKVE